MPENPVCPICRKPSTRELLAEARWYPFWERPDGACPGCVQQYLLETLLSHGDEALHRSVQSVWPLDAEGAFGALPTPLRLHADHRFQGRGVTIAFLDSGFYPHPDLICPRNRIRAWVQAGGDALEVRRFAPGDTPTWPGWDAAAPHQWHGMMTSTVAAGNGFLSHGLYAGLASEADVVLIQVRNDQGRITNETITPALRWLGDNAQALGVRVVSMSVSGDPVEPLLGNPVDEAVEALVRAGVSVVAAAGNDGVRRLIPPATAPLAFTVGGIDDHNTFSHDEVALWHGNYGAASNEVPKPELVAPSIWVAAPVLPGSEVAREALELFAKRGKGEDEITRRIAELKLITPHYQHVDGTSFAAPIVASTIACMLEANSLLTPLLVRDFLMQTAQPVPGAPADRQGAGTVDPGRAVARSLAERHGETAEFGITPRITKEGVVFRLHDHGAQSVQVFGSWSGWNGDALAATRAEAGLWLTPPLALALGEYAYKFLLDGSRWLDDPANPRKAHDGRGGLNSTFVIA